MEKKNLDKPKDKCLFYKLQLDIEISIDMKEILKEKILDSKIKFTLKEALDIVKKDSYKLIIDVMKRKIQMKIETIMIKALDSYLIEEDDQDIG